MEISKLKTLTTPSLNDILPILDINGGVSGRPILRKISLQSIFSLIDFNNNSGNSNSGFTIPTVTKTVAASGDYFIGIDGTGTPYRITKNNLLAGLSSGGTGNSGDSDSYFSNVPLLLHGNGSTITNNGSSTYSVSITNSSSVVTSIIKSKFDGSSLKFANPSYLDCVSSAFSPGSQDCTIELFFNIDTIPSGGKVLFDMRPDGINGNFPLVYFTATTINLQQNSQERVSSNQSIEVDTWYYVALRKISVVTQGVTEVMTQLWFQGIKVGEYVSGNWVAGGRILIGALAFRSAAPSTYFDGYIDEFRFSTVARDVSVIPVQRFPDN